MEGAVAIRQAVEAALKNISLSEYANSHPELETALDTWGQDI